MNAVTVDKVLTFSCLFIFLMYSELYAFSLKSAFQSAIVASFSVIIAIFGLLHNYQYWKEVRRK